MSKNDKAPSLRDIETITPYPLNAKKHGDEQVKRIAASIQKFGWRGNPIIVDKEGVIIAGHGRRLAALSLGIKKVPVVVEDDMTADEARAFRLADNRVSVSDIDDGILKEELMSLEFDFDGIFDKKELDFAVADLMMINEAALVTENIDEAMDKTRSSTNTRIAEANEKRVAIAKALGFNDVQGSEVIYVTRFMAQLEAETGKQGSAALVSFIKSLIGEIK